MSIKTKDEIYRIIKFNTNSASDGKLKKDKQTKLNAQQINLKK